MRFKKINIILFLSTALFVSSCGGGGGGWGGGGTETSGDTSTIGDGAITCGANTICGNAQYEDRTYDDTGFTGTVNLPIRFADVEALKGNAVIGAGTTDSSGDYSIPISDTGAVYVRVLTQTNGAYAVSVEDNRDFSIYAVASTTFDIAANESKTVDLTGGVNGGGPAFNIFDNAIKTQMALASLTGAADSTLITIYYYDGKKEGTYFTSNGGHIIAVLGSSSDSDAYDDSVLIHELGHYAAAVYSKDDSFGGEHSLGGHYDLRLTWSEGWATFFGSMVKDIAGESNPEYYVDTYSHSTDGSLRFAFSIESNDANTFYGADNEVAVSSILWDISDSSDDGGDTLSLGYDEIWNVFDDQLPLSGVVTFELFYDYWTAASYDNLDDILAGRSVKYLADNYESFEGNNDFSTAGDSTTYGSDIVHTFFPEGDKDYFKINVTSGTTYTFQTSDLGDGADTVLTLYNSDKIAVIDSNDDIVLGVNLASKIEWTADATKTVYILSQPYNEPDPPQVARYGYYTFSVTY